MTQSMKALLQIEKGNLPAVLTQFLVGESLTSHHLPLRKHPRVMLL